MEWEEGEKGMEVVVPGFPGFTVGRLDTTVAWIPKFCASVFLRFPRRSLGGSLDSLTEQLPMHQSNMESSTHTPHVMPLLVFCQLPGKACRLTLAQIAKSVSKVATGRLGWSSPDVRAWAMWLSPASRPGDIGGDRNGERSQTTQTSPLAPELLTGTLPPQFSQ